MDSNILKGLHVLTYTFTYLYSLDINKIPPGTAERNRFMTYHSIVATRLLFLLHSR